jgi:carotenoid cleavage dioxygenase-like enzyme
MATKELPYLAGNYGPVSKEHANVPLKPSFGEIPQALLGGEYVRNGPNAAAPPRSHLHWFDSDGMVGFFFFCVGAHQLTRFGPK